MKLHAVSDGPPSLAVRMLLKALNIPYELVGVNFNKGEHLTDAYAKLNPQKEIPVLEDDGFLLSEHIAIMQVYKLRINLKLRLFMYYILLKLSLQYICNKYAPESNLYPKDAKERALVDHRLCFNMAFYFSNIGAYTVKYEHNK